MSSESPFSKGAVDRLGERLCKQITAEDLQLLDEYRRSFHQEYEKVASTLRETLLIELTGRPAKSTPAIIEKLKRSSMRLSQMQDIAGCRTVVPDTIAQDDLVKKIQAIFPSTVFDRREKPSHGYRAVHVITKPGRLPIEIQVRTELQHLWAELSEKYADAFGMDVKHGGGDKNALAFLSALSNAITSYEAALIENAEFKRKIKELQEGADVFSKRPTAEELQQADVKYKIACESLEKIKLTIYSTLINEIKSLKESK